MDSIDENDDESLAAAFGAMADGIERKTEERIRAAVADEREACAKMAEAATGEAGIGVANSTGDVGWDCAAAHIARAIRARK